MERQRKGEKPDPLQAGNALNFLKIFLSVLDFFYYL